MYNAFFAGVSKIVAEAGVRQQFCTLLCNSKSSLKLVYAFNEIPVTFFNPLHQSHQEINIYLNRFMMKLYELILHYLTLLILMM